MGGLTKIWALRAPGVKPKPIVPFWTGWGEWSSQNWPHRRSRREVRPLAPNAPQRLDSVEHMFGIIHQSSGCNAHPSPDQFLIAVNCLSLYNMARSVDGENGTPDIINTLLIVDDKTPNISSNSVDDLLAQLRLKEAEESLAIVEGPVLATYN
ncbi:hypothetical protein HPB49_014389 [Dermacentor silvarum]|uniref:Uncharacterized protein n=1 Tax=Dermacentor silvarum TaxID=543639 RepID=A0ACB8CLK4_DERSI|nr:hypothetical protein HPB49_014389 [Dermacentor silvarum]